MSDAAKELDDLLAACRAAGYLGTDVRTTIRAIQARHERPPYTLDREGWVALCGLSRLAYEWMTHVADFTTAAKMREVSEIADREAQCR